MIRVQRRQVKPTYLPYAICNPAPGTILKDWTPPLPSREKVVLRRVTTAGFAVTDEIFQTVRFRDRVILEGTIE